MNTNSTITEIDKAHLAANSALSNKDFPSYINCFSDDLKYIQLDGETIDKSRLAKDIQKYFGRIRSYTSKYDRTTCLFDEELFVENLIQKATVTLKVFLFFSKKWKFEREGIYKWRKINGSWKIISVKIINERTY